MRKKAIIAGVILVVLVGAFAVVLLNLEGLVNRNKDFLLSRAESTLGRKISVGEIGIALWGGIGVRLQDFALADDPEYSSQPFIEAKDLQINLKLLPLFKKEFEVKRVILHDPVIRVIRNESGHLNVNTFGTDGAGTTEADVAVGAAAPLAVSLINIDGGELHYSDQSTGLDLRITQIESHVEDFDFDRPVSLTMRAAVLSDRKNLELAGTFGPIGDDGDTSSLPVDTKVSIEAIEIANVIALFPAMKETIPPRLEVNGPVAVTVEATGTFPKIPMNVSIDASALSLTLPEKFQKRDDIPLRLTSIAEFTEGRIQLKEAKLVFATLEALIQGDYLLGDAPSVDLTVKAERTSLAGWDAILPALAPYKFAGDLEFDARVRGEVAGLKPGGELSGVEGSARISGATMSLPQLPKPLTDVDATIAIKGERLRIENSSLRAGDSQIQGNAIVESLAPVTIRYEATSSSLALADVRPPNPTAKKPEVMKDVVAKGRMIAERSINQGELTSSSGSMANYDYQNLSTKYFIEDKQARLDDIAVQALGGNLEGSGTVIFDEQSPAFNFDTRSRDLNLVETMDALPMFAKEHVRGRANLDLKISGKGKEWTNVQETITGDGFAEMFEGELVDVNVFDNILSALTDATGVKDWISQAVKTKYPKVFSSKNTYFEELKSTFVIEDGKLLARNLRLDASDYVMIGKGGIDFNRGLDLRVTLLMSHALTADVVNDVKEAKYLKNDSGQIEIPFVLTGTLPRVTAKPDPNYLNQVIQKALTQQGLDLFNKKGIKDIFNFNKKDKAPADSLR